MKYQLRQISREREERGKAPRGAAAARSAARGVRLRTCDVVLGRVDADGLARAQLREGGGEQISKSICARWRSQASGPDRPPCECMLDRLPHGRRPGSWTSRAVVRNHHPNSPAPVLQQARKPQARSEGWICLPRWRLPKRLLQCSHELHCRS